MINKKASIQETKNSMIINTTIKYFEEGNFFELKLPKNSIEITPNEWRTSLLDLLALAMESEDFAEHKNIPSLIKQMNLFFWCIENAKNETCVSSKEAQINRKAA